MECCGTGISLSVVPRMARRINLWRWRYSTHITPQPRPWTGTACGRKRLTKPIRRKNAERSDGGGLTGDQIMNDKNENADNMLESGSEDDEDDSEEVKA